MRNHIINAGIIAGEEAICREIYNSLRYSTHVNLFIFQNSDTLISFDCNCPIISFKQNQNENLLEALSIRGIEVLFIADYNIDKELIEVSKKLQLCLLNQPINFERNEFKINQDSISKKLSIFLKEMKNEITHFHSQKIPNYNKLEYNKIILDFFKDIEGEVIFINLVFFYNDGIREFYIGNDFDDFIYKKYFQETIDAFDFSGIKSISVSNNNNFEVDFIASHLGWNYYRALGVNIPLLCIQNYLARKIIVQPFIQNEFLNWSNNSNGEISIDIDFSILFIDLDETLIINDNKVDRLIKLIEIFKSSNKEVILVTRHKEEDILSTLNLAGIDSDLFKKIIHVRKKEKKSQFINSILYSRKIAKEGIFIDNEFPERLDVYKHCNIATFDVNVIDFINVGKR